jgi:hypothetical protein
MGTSVTDEAAMMNNLFRPFDEYDYFASLNDLKDYL